MPDISSFAEIISRPLFSKSRMAISDQHRFRLHGTAFSDYRRVAIVEHLGSIARMVEGDVISDWKLIQIDHNAIILEKNFTQIRIAIVPHHSWTEDYGEEPDYHEEVDEESWGMVARESAGGDAIQLPPAPGDATMSIHDNERRRQLPLIAHRGLPPPPPVAPPPYYPFSPVE